MDDVELRRPEVADGAAVARLAQRAGGLDVNSSYAYVLWCRDFADTSVIASIDGSVAGFITGYPRPVAPSTLFVWQVAVDPDRRGLGIARQMLDALAERLGPTHVEATVTADNTASWALFTSFARRHDAAVERTPLFASSDFPDAHEPEELLRIGPLG